MWWLGSSLPASPAPLPARSYMSPAMGGVFHSSPMPTCHFSALSGRFVMAYCMVATIALYQLSSAWYVGHHAEVTPAGRQLLAGFLLVLLLMVCFLPFKSGASGRPRGGAAATPALCFSPDRLPGPAAATPSTPARRAAPSRGRASRDGRRGSTCWAALTAVSPRLQVASGASMLTSTWMSRSCSHHKHSTEGTLAPGTAGGGA